MLEPRTLLALVAADPQFQVNQLTDPDPGTPVAVDANGNFVVVWDGIQGLFGRRYDAANDPLGDQFLIAAGNLALREPGVAMDADGDFVVVWTPQVNSGSSTLYARRYDAAGEPQGSQFAVATGYYPGLNSGKAIAMDADGDFIIAWSASGGIYGRRYSAAGASQGNEFVIAMGSDLAEPTVAMDAGGDFVVAWMSYDQGFFAYARRYSADGAPQCAAFRVSSAPGGVERSPHVAMDAGGDFVVAWKHELDNDGGAIYARRFGADGTALGIEFLVSPSRDAVGTPSVAMDAEGDFVVTWWSNDPYDPDVFASEFRSDGAILDADVLVGHIGNEPTVAMDTRGDVVVTWINESGSGRLYARRLARVDAAAVVGRQIFYNHSVYDGSAAAGSADDQAIVSYRQALRPGQQPTVWNVTSYSRGINGIIVDVAGLPRPADPSNDCLPAGDFKFLAGDGTFEGWGDAPPPVSITVRRGAGFAGSDRVTLIWEDGAVRDEWLKVTVLANESTGLAAADAFSFGNLAGEVFDRSPGSNLVLTVTATDLFYLRHWLLRFKQNPGANILNRFDFNRDGRFDIRDVMIVRSSLLHSLALIDPITAPAPALRALDVRKVWDDPQPSVL